MGAVTVVRAMAVYDGKLWCGGVGGEIWTFDGTDWALQASGAWAVCSNLVTFDGRIYGTFTLPYPAGGEVRYSTGGEWTTDEVIAWPRTFMYLCEYDGNLYVVDDAVRVWRREEPDYVQIWAAGGGTPSNMAVYDGKLWLARGPDGKVYSSEGGEFSLEYDGSDGDPWYIASYGGELWVGLYGDTQVFRYDGVSWSEEGFDDFRRIRALAAVGGQLWIGTGYYARVYAWDGEVYCLDFQPSVATSQHDTYVFCEFNGDVYAGTSCGGHVFRLTA